jgi:hypothetical protein
MDIENLTYECYRCGAMAMNCMCETGPMKRVGVGDAVAEQIPMIVKRVMFPNGDCGCEDLAKEMNEAGPDGVEANMDHYVAQIASKGPALTMPLNQMVAANWIQNAIGMARCEPCAKGAEQQ